MKITTVLFDLDGTLLPLDQDLFIKEYFRLITEYIFLKKSPDEAKIYGASLKNAVFAMMQNDGTVSNEDLFGRLYREGIGKDESPDELFEEFYDKYFIGLKNVCGFDTEADKIVKYVKSLGLRTALATNPAFPKEATAERIRWAGLEKDDFELVTSYENASFCKPHLGYYEEVVRKLGVSPEECIMIGNDTLDDMDAKKLGMKVFLLTNNLVNRTGRDINNYPNGGWDSLRCWLAETVG